MPTRLTRFLYWLTAHRPARIIDGPDGEPYLERYYLCRLFGFTAYIHRLVDNDPDRGLHDHPWAWSCSLVLAGGYHEIRATHIAPHEPVKVRIRCLRPWRWNVIRGDTFHRIIIHWNRANDHHARAWTLFIHGRRIKGWGFVKPIAGDHGYKSSAWPIGATPMYIPYRLDRHSPAEGWHRTAPKGRDINRAPLR